MFFDKHKKKRDQVPPLSSFSFSCLFTRVSEKKEKAMHACALFIPPGINLDIFRPFFEDFFRFFFHRLSQQLLQKLATIAALALHNDFRVVSGCSRLGDS